MNDITKDILITYQTPEECEVLQLVLFSLGYIWVDDKKIYQTLANKYLPRLSYIRINPFKKMTFGRIAQLGPLDKKTKQISYADFIANN